MLGTKVGMKITMLHTPPHTVAFVLRVLAALSAQRLLHAWNEIWNERVQYIASNTSAQSISLYPPNATAVALFLDPSIHPLKPA